MSLVLFFRITSSSSKKSKNVCSSSYSTRTVVNLTYGWREHIREAKLLVYIDTPWQLLIWKVPPVYKLCPDGSGPKQRLTSNYSSGTICGITSPCVPLFSALLISWPSSSRETRAILISNFSPISKQPYRRAIRIFSLFSFCSQLKMFERFSNFTLRDK